VAIEEILDHIPHDRVAHPMRDLPHCHILTAPPCHCWSSWLLVAAVVVVEGGTMCTN